MIREPAVAGQFYPANPQRLQENIRSFLSRSEALLDVKGIVAPCSRARLIWRCTASRTCRPWCRRA